MKRIPARIAYLLFGTALCAGGAAFAQAPAGAAPDAAAAAPAYTEAQLDELVGPIALYPDDLVALILPASTFPIDVVRADRFLDTYEKTKNKDMKPDPNWHASVQNLLNTPDVIRKMSKELDWTMALGDAVTADTGAVMDAVQRFRRKTYAAGNLKTDDKQVVVVEKETIIVEPADPKVIYVPQYEPSTVVVTGYSGTGTTRMATPPTTTPMRQATRSRRACSGARPSAASGAPTGVAAISTSTTTSTSTAATAT
jgi:hypothetical protein